MVVVHCVLRAHHAVHVCLRCRNNPITVTNCDAEYGQCGTGAYCLGGCDPINSYSLNACVPMPVCQSTTYNFNDLSGIEANTKYLGDASKADWSSSGEPAEYQSTALLTMSEGTVGTLLASTHYVWYGKIGAKMKTSAGAGVVTAFILMSDTKDEIDFEFIGTDLLTAQTNFYSLGITNCKSRPSIWRSFVLIYLQMTMERTQQSPATQCKIITTTKLTGHQTHLHGPLMEM